ncbi:hypothetical protein [Methylobacterium brachythecii]|uniref:Uncharacterized protein n=1 Tax=Methylobacterium brachythecii TaxID=1176177 RepID=A0A7W6AM30_9HYPH|nr:hypothetical protein [Methylobacterium brachythecii]MBB3905128.1 hypothetical protein [Methylobacterium brachythecii]GLS44364.1 hypothetical protein GCM10007884_23520 [Methylobacterium brachythecii]
MSFFGDLFGGQASKKAAAASIARLDQAKTEGNTDLDTGYNTAADQYGRAGDLFGNLAGQYAGGSKLYLDASGANGVDAAKAAQGQFTFSPAYQVNLDQGMQGLDRARAVNGTLASGGADTDAMKFASGLASQEYGNWLNNLGNIDTKRDQAVAGQAGTIGAIGQAALGTGSAKAGLASSTAQNQSTVQMQAAKAQEDGAGRLLGGILGVGNLASKGAGSLFGSGGGYSIFGGGGWGSG